MEILIFLFLLIYYLNIIWILFCIVVCRGDDVVLIYDIVRVLVEENVVKDVVNVVRFYGVSLVGIKYYFFELLIYMCRNFDISGLIYIN